MKPHSFRYFVYDPDGRRVFDSSRKDEASLWLGGGRYMVRRDLLGNYPDKTFY
jgi:hypothetical protein